MLKSEEIWICKRDLGNGCALIYDGLRVREKVNEREREREERERRESWIGGERIEQKKENKIKF